MNERLEPCPLCHSADQVNYHPTDGVRYGETRCDNCGLCLSDNIADGGYYSRASVKAWNTRTPQPEQAEPDLTIFLDPRRWTREMNDAWHGALPNTQAAFDALRALAAGNPVRE